MPELALHKGFQGYPDLTVRGAFTMFRPKEAVESVRNRIGFGT